MIPLQETIRPSADLRNHYNEISKQCREEKKQLLLRLTDEEIPCLLHMKSIKI